MKNVLYLSLIVLFAFGGCKKKGDPDPDPTPVDNTPTMNYIKFTLNGPGYNNTKILWSKAKNTIQRHEYSEATNGVINVDLEMVSGDSLLQVHLNENTTGNKPFSSGAIFFVFSNLNATNSITATSSNGSYNIISLTPTQIVVNSSSGLKKGKFQIDATFSGILLEDSNGDTYTLSDGVVKFDGN
jgi:hypothetical protein